MTSEKRLRDVAEIIMGQSPPGSTYNETGNGLPFFQGVRDFNYRTPTVRVFCSEPSRTARPGDILFSVRAPIGRVNVADCECAIGRGLSIIRAKSQNDQQYIEFVLRLNESSWNNIEGGGSVFGNATRSDLESFLIPWPVLSSERQAIACILGALDDKIELNRRMNETLEAMARAIFKSWFVDFDPVRAKAAGQQPPGLKPDLAALFPDAFEDSEQGEIPKGWRMSNVGQHFRLTMGQSPPGSTYNETGEGVPFYQGRTDFGFRFPSRRVFCNASTRFAEPGDTLVSVRAPVGDMNMASERCAVGRGVAAIRHRSGGRSFTYYSIHHFGDNFDKFEAEGTVFGCINKFDFERLPFIVPTPEVLTAFNRIVSPVDDQIETSEQQTSILAGLREALLPKLISGELRMPDAERIVGRYV